MRRTLPFIAVVALWAGSTRAEPAEASAPEPEADDRIRVYGRAPPDAAGEHRVDRRLLSHKPARTTDELLELVPGIYVVQHGSEGKGHQLYIRGFDALHGSDVEVRLEGIPLNEPGNVHGHGYVDLGLVMPEVVAGLSAIRGVSAVTQGDFATAGTVELKVGVDPSERGTRLAVEGGSTGRLRGVARWAPDQPGTVVAVEGTRDQGFGENRAMRRGVAVARGELAVGGGALTGFAAASHADFGLPGAVRLDDVDSGRVGLTDSYADDTGGQASRVVGGLRFEGRLDAARLRAGAWAQARSLRLDERFTGYLDDPERGDGHRQLHEAWSAGLDARLGWRLGPRWRLVGALDWAVDDFAQSQAPLGDDGQLGALDRDLRATAHRGALAGAARFRPLPWLSIEGGLRAAGWRFAADDGRFGAGSATLGALAPRLRSRAALGDWMLFAAYGRGLRPPEARAVVRPDAIGDAPPERYQGGEAAVTLADHGELGARWQPSDGVTLTAAAFAVAIEREQLYDHVSATTIERGATRRAGLELDLALDPWPWLHLALGGAAVEARFADGAPIPGVPSLLGRLDAAVEHPSGWQGGLSALALGPRPLGDGAQAAPAAVVDATLGYRWSALGAELAVELAVENVFDAPWREGEYRFASWWDRDRPRSALPAIHAFAGAPRQGRLSFIAWL